MASRRLAPRFLVLAALLSTPRPSAAAPEVSSPGKAPASKLGPYRIQAADGSSLEVGFAAQLRATITDSGKSFTHGGRKTEDFEELRRVRWLLRGAALEDRLRFAVQLNTTAASPELMDWWLDYKFARPLRLRAGQFKIPFTRYRWNAFSQQVFMEWPIAANHFGAERQLGLLLHNGQKDDGPWSYALGLFTGVNARASFATGIADAYGEKLPNPSSLRSPAAPADLHPEVVARVSHNARGIDTSSGSDERGGELRHSVGLSAAWDLNAVPGQDFAERIAPELLLKAYGVSLNLVGYLGVFRPGQGLLAVASTGATAEAAWRFHPHWEVAARHSRVNFTRELRAAGRRHADQIIASADPAQQKSLTKQYAAAGAIHSSQATTVGLNWYLIGHSLKLQSDVAWLYRESPSRQANDLRVRLQLTLAI